jgi:hypothetical protein
MCKLRGFAARTQEAYVAAAEQLANYYHKLPDEIGEEEPCQPWLYFIKRGGALDQHPDGDSL